MKTTGPLNFLELLLGLVRTTWWSSAVSGVLCLGQILGTLCLAANSWGAAERSKSTSAPEGGQVTSPEISERACPVEMITIPCADGHHVTGFTRRPPGAGPFPTVIFLHGGLVP